MKPGLNRPESNLIEVNSNCEPIIMDMDSCGQFRPESNVIEFYSIGEPEIIFMHSYAQLTAMGIRHDIAQQLASYAAFQGKKFDPESPMLVHLHEEIGQEPAVQGKMAA